MKLLAITSCPNGIAHTYMAAENIQKAADKFRHSNESRNARRSRC
ncbi:MAG: hypothetical protein ACI35P_10440 [Bacillus sp. (in: firmicutes)]